MIKAEAMVLFVFRMCVLGSKVKYVSYCEVTAKNFESPRVKKINLTANHRLKLKV